MSDRPDRNPVRASYWQFNMEDADPEVEAMPAALSFVRDDEHVLIAVRGRPRARGRYEPHDAAWVELTDAEAMRLIERLAAALNARPKPPRPTTTTEGGQDAHSPLP